ncbi:MAG TPA: acyl-ACP--UDP-N-acetylglucosamine O-acyltransferase [Acidobacteriaceae bacterium]|nr:acyl-ACP--UDP-N-acetylglucosamine O-acyltransferase [Acidobacteriaceae bacterium]
MSIHPTAVIAPGAVIPASCRVGPWCSVGADVVLGEECELISHVVLDGRLTAGAGNSFSPFACVGVAPQDLKYRGEPTGVTLGNDNSIRECVTISRGTVGGGGMTAVGSHCLIMAYAHVGHDSVIGDHCILANNATLAGHVVVEDYATIGAFSPVHQFCRVGRHAYIGGGTVVTQDVLPFSLTSATREARAFGINKVGLKRRGFDAERLRRLHHAYHWLVAAKMNTSQALEKLRAEAAGSEDVRYLLDFIEQSQRGIVR